MVLTLAAEPLLAAAVGIVVGLGVGYALLRAVRHLGFSHLAFAPAWGRLTLLTAAVATLLVGVRLVAGTVASRQARAGALRASDDQVARVAREAGRRRRWTVMGAALRGFVIFGLVVIATAAATVPVPLRVVAPGALVAVGDSFSMRLHGVAPDRSPGPVSGAVLGVRQRDAVPVAAVLWALVDPGRDVRPRTGPVNGGSDHPLTRAALYGVGMSPHRFQEVDATVAVDQVDSRSLAAALYAFDAMVELDWVAGRRILALGYVGTEEALVCPARLARSIEAAAAAAVDVVTVPTACAGQAHAAAPPGSRLDIRDADSFLEVLTVVGP